MRWHNSFLSLSVQASFVRNPTSQSWIEPGMPALNLDWCTPAIPVAGMCSPIIARSDLALSKMITLWIMPVGWLPLRICRCRIWHLFDVAGREAWRLKVTECYPSNHSYSIFQRLQSHMPKQWTPQASHSRPCRPQREVGQRKQPLVSQHSWSPLFQLQLAGWLRPTGQNVVRPHCDIDTPRLTINRQLPCRSI